MLQWRRFLDPLYGELHDRLPELDGQDLQPWREAVFDAILKLEGYHCVRMEDFGPVDGAAAEVCRERVARCDVFVGLVGHLHGSRPEGNERSYTELEYETAGEQGKPRLMVLAARDFLLAADLLGDDAISSMPAQRRFREQVEREKVAGYFTKLEGLATIVVTALQNHQAEAGRRAAGKRRHWRREGSRRSGRWSKRWRRTSGKIPGTR